MDALLRDHIITFDTLEFMGELERSGMHHKQADALTKATARAFGQMMETKELANKADLNQLKEDLQVFIFRSITTTIVILTGLQIFFHYVR